MSIFGAFSGDDDFIPMPAEGDLLPQKGGTWGAVVMVEGNNTIMQPTRIIPKPPTMVGKTRLGRPKYQGMPELRLEWANADIDTYQAMCVPFFERLNGDEGPIVTLLWPDPAEAGRYRTVKAYMEWPTISAWENGFIAFSVNLSSFSREGQGIFFNSGQV